MKKTILAVLFAGLIVLSLAACGAKKDPEPQPSGLVGLANPWTDVAGADEAAEGAGVGYFTVPDSGTKVGNDTLNLTAFRCMTGIAEADGTLGSAELTIRKGLKQDSTDVSGDYTAYAQEWTLENDGVQIRCFGAENGKVLKAVWVTDNFSYSIVLGGAGLSADDTLALVAAIQ